MTMVEIEDVITVNDVFHQAQVQVTVDVAVASFSQLEHN
jgi:hypothetical protein